MCCRPFRPKICYDLANSKKIRISEEKILLAVNELLCVSPTCILVVAENVTWKMCPFFTCPKCVNGDYFMQSNNIWSSREGVTVVKLGLVSKGGRSKFVLMGAICLKHDQTDGEYNLKIMKRRTVLIALRILWWSR